MTEEGPFFDPIATRYEEEGLFARDLDDQLIRLDPATAADYDKPVILTIDEEVVRVPRAVPTTNSMGDIVRDAEGLTVPRATTIYDAATQLFDRELRVPNPIPILCHQPHLRPVAVCRVCSVVLGKKQKDGRMRWERRFVPACQHLVEEGMEVYTSTYRRKPLPDLLGADERQKAETIRKQVEQLRVAIKTLAELLGADHLRPDHPFDQSPLNELTALATRVGAQPGRFPPSLQQCAKEPSKTLLIQVERDACILCDRCIRGCSDVRHHFVIGRTGKGQEARIGFDLNVSMKDSSCVECGECLISCPTGALTVLRPVLAKSATRADKPGVLETVPAEDLKQRPLFEKLPFKFLSWNANAVIRRRLQAREVLVREGEPGATAFILEQGALNVSIESSLWHIQNNKPEGWLSRFLGHSVLKRVSRAGRAAAGLPITFRSDSCRPLSSHNPVNLLGPDPFTLIGESSCLNNYPRAATITAVEESVVLELRRNVLLMMLRDPITRERINKGYRDSALVFYLEGLPLLASLGVADRARLASDLRDKVEFLRVEPGQVIFRQGERADSLFMVRIGFVRVSQTFHQQEITLEYVGPGGNIGEVGLISDRSPELRQKLEAAFPRGVQPFSCTALDHVELVRIRKQHVEELLDANPTLERLLAQACCQLMDRLIGERQHVGSSLGDHLAQGLYHARRLLVLDLERCTRCDECTKACADTHGGHTRLIREGLRFDNYLVATSCRSCLDPLCMAGCPVDSIHRTNGREIVIEDHCVGCGLCSANCPYGNILMIEEQKSVDHPASHGRKLAVIERKATTCDLCQNVVRDGEAPSCVYACPHDAAFRMTGEELMTRVRERGRQ